MPRSVCRCPHPHTRPRGGPAPSPARGLSGGVCTTGRTSRGRMGRASRARCPISDFVHRTPLGSPAYPHRRPRCGQPFLSRIRRSVCNGNVATLARQQVQLPVARPAGDGPSGAEAGHACARPGPAETSARSLEAGATPACTTDRADGLHRALTHEPCPSRPPTLRWSAPASSLPTLTAPTPLPSSPPAPASAVRPPTNGSKWIERCRGGGLDALADRFHAARGHVATPAAPPIQRALLAQHLTASLDDGDEVERVWSDEAARRSDALASGEATAVPPPMYSPRPAEPLRDRRPVPPPRRAARRGDVLRGAGGRARRAVHRRGAGGPRTFSRSRPASAPRLSGTARSGGGRSAGSRHLCDLQGEQGHPRRRTRAAAPSLLVGAVVGGVPPVPSQSTCLVGLQTFGECARSFLWSENGPRSISDVGAPTPTRGNQSDGRPLSGAIACGPSRTGRCPA